ncbi:hypothetical protein A4G26_19625 [Mycobacterium kansasii]|nr:hypothetical protein A4G26_19625 [Mycobacterium kansasii]
MIAVPDLMDQAATDFSAIGSTLNAAHLTAAAPTLSVLPAAADEVSSISTALGYAASTAIAEPAPTSTE